MPSLRVEHAYQEKDGSCQRCGRSVQHHRVRVRHDNRRNRQRPRRVDRIIGIDGEGIGRRPHKYIYLASADERGRAEAVRNEEGLTTEQALTFLVNLPDRALIVAYSFFYDLTKILKDLPDESLYYLLHEELRAVIRDGRIIYRSVHWNGFRLNFMNRRFSVQRGKKRITVWDIFAFFQSKFTTALGDWKICSEAEIKRIEEMKEQRSVLDSLPRWKVEEYCNSECTYLAQLARALINAHNEAGFALKSFYGAGSTASSLLTLVDARRFISEIPGEMKDALSRSFFGGRFENSVHGPILGPCYNADISSAYPYQTTFLPCLSCGKWSRCNDPSRSDIDGATLALIRWRIDIECADKKAAFGPFPVRSTTGTIAFPLSGVGGWTWKQEFIAGQKLCPGAQAVEAWLYHNDCDHRPFERVPEFYRERCRWGKDGKGIVLKLGPNAIYGKVAQSRGLNPPFQCWVWAANITSGTRAQLLEAIDSVKNPWDILMLATDGVWSRLPLQLPTPKDTGTFDLAKPLGGWEHKEFPAGVFCARPGIYFPLNPNKDELKQVRARGVGKKALYERWKELVEAWSQGKEKVHLGGLTRFFGAKSSIHAVGGGYRRSEDYGEWNDDHRIDVSFNPGPKRRGFGRNQKLLTWHHFDWLSEPYEPAIKSPEAIALMIAEQIANEQPNTDFLDLY